MPSVGVFAAIFDEEGRILLVRSATGRKGWSLPGGGIERGESPTDALRREVTEESGYRIDPGPLLGIYSTPFKDNLVLTFEASIVGRGKWAPNSEISEYGWYAAAALPEPIRPRAHIRIQDAFERNYGTVRTFKRDDGNASSSVPTKAAGG